MHRLPIIVAALTLTGCASPPAEHHHVYGTDSRQMPVERGDPMWRTGSGERVVLHGTVQDVTRMSPDFPPYDHTLIQLRLSDGRVQLVDLGPQSGVADLPVAPGDAMAVEGRVGQRHGRWVISAERVRVGGDWWDIDPARRERR